MSNNRKRRDTFGGAFDTATAELPKKLFADALDKKLKEKGIRLSQNRLNRMAVSALKGEPINFKTFFERIKKALGMEVKEVVIEFNDDDTEAVKNAADELIKKLPKVLHELIESAPPDLLVALKKDWAREKRLQAGDKFGFTKRLHKRWGKGLDLLEMSITIAREIGSNINTDLRTAHTTPKLVDVLTRLHARGCQIAEEIVCLLQNGFSDGAMARWRTLYEIAVVSSLLHEHGEDLAERYVAHEVIESAKAAKLFQKHHDRLGQTAMSSEEIADIEQQRDALIAKYGKEFGGSYGWAAKHLNIQSPTFAQLVEAAKIDHLSPYYKMASHNVHANPKGIFFKLGHIGESEVLLAGPTNAGLADPGHGTAISLMQITTALALVNPTIDDVIGMKILDLLQVEIGDALVDSHVQLKLDEESRARNAVGGSVK